MIEACDQETLAALIYAHLPLCIRHDDPVGALGFNERNVTIAILLGLKRQATGWKRGRTRQIQHRSARLWRGHRYLTADTLWE